MPPFGVEELSPPVYSFAREAASGHSDYSGSRSIGRLTNDQSRTFAELLIDCEEDRALWAVLVGMLREASR